MFLIKTVRFKNFRSYGNQFTEVKLDKAKTTAVTAPNGSGKSTMLMAIEFGLFGKVTAGINKNDLVNTVNNKDMLVEIDCSTAGKEILIRRGHKPALFEIFIDGNMVSQEASIRDYQTYLEEEILGFNLNTFRQIVSISGSNYTPFFVQTAAQRRGIIEELLNLTVFTRMHKLHLAAVSENREELKELDSVIGQYKASIASLKKGLSSLQEQEDDYKAKIDANIDQARLRIERYNEEIKDFTQRIEMLQAKTKGVKKTQIKREKLNEFSRDMKTKITKLNEYIGFFSDREVCPTCSQDIPHEFRKDQISKREGKKAEIEHNLQKLIETLSKTDSDLDDMRVALEEVRELENAIAIKNGNIDELHGYIDTQLNQKNHTSAGSEDLKTEIIEVAEKLEKEEVKRLDILEEKSYNDVISSVIKDNGIKSKIISQYIPKMVSEINRYLEILDVGISFDMDENFNEKILSRFKDELSYSSFSAGERARIDIAILFTWRELAKMKNSLSCNLLFLDEIFDSVLDDTGLESFINLLAYHLEDTNVFLISHRSEVVDKFESNLRIVKTSTFSKIE